MERVFLPEKIFRVGVVQCTEHQYNLKTFPFLSLCFCFCLSSPPLSLSLSLLSLFLSTVSTLLSLSLSLSLPSSLLASERPQLVTNHRMIDIPPSTHDLLDDPQLSPSIPLSVCHVPVQSQGFHHYGPVNPPPGFHVNFNGKSLSSGEDFS